MIDPGHGGINPGAVRDGVNEKDLVLTLGRGLAEALIRTGEVKAFLTRNDDSFFLCLRVFRRRIKWVVNCLFHYMLMRSPTGRRRGQPFIRCLMTQVMQRLHNWHHNTIALTLSLALT